MQLALERLIVVLFPLRAYSLTLKRSAAACASVLVALATFNVGVVYTVTSLRKEVERTCASM